MKIDFMYPLEISKVSGKPDMVYMKFDIPFNSKASNQTVDADDLIISSPVPIQFKSESEEQLANDFAGATK
jgi:hypothetical protein